MTEKHEEKLKDAGDRATPETPGGPAAGKTGKDDGARGSGRKADFRFAKLDGRDSLKYEDVADK